MQSNPIEAKVLEVDGVEPIKHSLKDKILYYDILVIYKDTYGVSKTVLRVETEEEVNKIKPGFKFKH